MPLLPFFDLVRHLVDTGNAWAALVLALALLVAVVVLARKPPARRR